jgi:hypothetical protein
MKKMCEIEEEMKFCDDEVRTILYGSDSIGMLRFGSLNKEDAKGKGYFSKRKKFLEHRGRLVQCFLYDKNHFTIDYPMKTNLKWLEEDQV